MVGTVIFVLIFMLALGSMAYASGLQSQVSVAEAEAQQVAAQRNSESLAFSSGASGLMVSDRGPSSVTVNHIILRFPNGTVYTLPIHASVPQGASAGVEALVPAGVCSPGTATCLSKYDQIVTGGAAGSQVGLVTSLGNSFWYSSAGTGGSGPTFRFAASTVSTSSGTFVSVPGLSFSGSPGGTYVVDFSLGYYQSAGISNLVYFGVAAPGDAKMMACADISASTNPYQPSCSSVSGTQLAQTTCSTQSSSPVCAYGMRVFIAFGSSGGVLQLEFRSNGGVTAYVAQGSYMLVSQLT